MNDYEIIRHVAIRSLRIAGWWTKARNPTAHEIVLGLGYITGLALRVPGLEKQVATLINFNWDQ